MALRGSIEDVPVVDVLQFVHLSGKSGALSLAGSTGGGWVEFANGNIVFARGPRTRSLGELLVESGALTAARLSEAIERQRGQSDRPPLGKLLVSLGLVDGAQLAEAVRRQIQDAMLDLCGWTEGEFQFDQGAVEVLDDTRVDVAEVLPKLDLNTQFLLLEAARLFDERRRQEERTLPPNAREITPPQPQRRITRRRDPSRVMVPVGAVALPSQRRIDAPLSEVAQLIRSLPLDAPFPRLIGEPAQPKKADDPLALGMEPAPVVTRAEAGLLLVGFEKLLHPLVSQTISRAGHRVLGHVPRPSIHAELHEGRRWPPTMALLWRVRAGEGEREEALRQLEHLERIRTNRPDWTVVALVSGDDRKMTGRLYQAGVRSVVPIDPGEPESEVLDGVVAALGQVWRDNERAAHAQAAELKAWVQAKRVTAEIHRALQREGIKLELLRVAAHTLDRGVLLLLEDERLGSIGAFGQSADGRPLAEALREVSVRPAERSPLVRCLSEQTAFVGPTGELGLGDAFFAAIGRPTRDRAVLVPLVGTTRVLGVLYGDNGDRAGPIRGIHAIELAASQAGVAYENVLLRLERAQGDAA